MSGVLRNDSGNTVRIPGDPVNFQMVAGFIMRVLCTRIVDLPPSLR